MFLPKDKVSLAQLIQPISNGALVLSLDTDFDGCMALVQRLTEDKGIYLANSMNSLRIEGQKTIAIEMVQQFDWEVPDWIVIPGGNLGNVSALGAGFELMQRAGPDLAACRASWWPRPSAPTRSTRPTETGWDTFEPVAARRPRPRAIQIGNPVSVQKAIRILKKFDGDRGAGQRGRAGQRRRPRRPLRHLQLPAHRRGAGRPASS